MMLAKRALNLLLAGTVAIATTPAQAQFGGLGSIVNHAKQAKKVGDSMREIGPAEEEKIGGDLASMILGAAPLVDNPAEQHYVSAAFSFQPPASTVQLPEPNRESAIRIEVKS